MARGSTRPVALTLDRPGLSLPSTPSARAPEPSIRWYQTFTPGSTSKPLTLAKWPVGWVLAHGSDFLCCSWALTMNIAHSEPGCHKILHVGRYLRGAGGSFLLGYNFTMSLSPLFTRVRSPRIPSSPFRRHRGVSGPGKWWGQRQR